MEFHIISIGTTRRNLLWGESTAMRTQHTTTTLLRVEGKSILVDPSLPADLLEARLFDRTGEQFDSITDVFCTTLRPDSRRALLGGDASPLAHANWWTAQGEIDWYTSRLADMVESAKRIDTITDELKADIAALKRIRPASDTLAPGVSLYPLPGVTPGCCGLLLAMPSATVLLTGPAAISRQHLIDGMIAPDCIDKDAAMESLSEVLDIADLIIPGYDNVCFAR
jgi:glyoxylase-like metal-dependent hydrolase (beta-lactamase superfamily II)